MPDAKPKAILAFDFDGTLVDSPSDPFDIARLEQLLTHMRRRGAIWGINTGRTLYHTLDGIREHGFRLTPDFIIARECEVYHLNGCNRWTDLGDWNARCHHDHKRFYRAHNRFFRSLQQYIATSPDAEGARFISDRTEPAGIVTRDEDAMHAICQWIDARLPEWPDLGYQRNSIWLRFSHQGYNKGTALREVRRIFDVGAEFTFAAGDNYNDLPMLRHEVAHGLACPGNAVPDVSGHVGRLGGFVAQNHATLGVISAIEHYFYQHA